MRRFVCLVSWLIRCFILVMTVSSKLMSLSHLLKSMYQQSDLRYRICVDIFGVRFVTVAHQNCRS